jgi:fucose permease
MAGFSAVTAVTISAAFVFGMVLALLGSLKLALAKRLALNERSIAGLLSALNLALIPMMLLTGLLIDRLGVRPVLVLGSLVTAAAIFSLSLQPTYRKTFAAILLAGLGGAALSTGSTVLMPQAFFGPTSAALNLGNVFFALGALVTPALCDVLLRTLEYRRTVSMIAVLCLVPALVALVAEGVQAPAAEGANLSGSSNLTQLWFAALVFFCYAPLEGSISIWTTTYLTELGIGERRATWLLSGFWTAFLASRLLTAFAQHGGLLPPVTDPWVIVVPALAVAVVLGNLAGNAQRGSAWRGLLLLGFLLGPIFPTLVGIVFRLFPGQEGTAYGTMFAVGSTGSLVLAPLIGASVTRRSVQTTLRIPMLIALALSGAALVLALTVRY